MSPNGPESMREHVAAYVRTLHATYLSHVGDLPPGERAALPLLLAGEVTVVAAAARRLHLIATTDRLPVPTGSEVELRDTDRGLTWAVRFYDVTVLPVLGLLTDDTADEVRRVLGISAVYHLTIGDGGGLTEHHAQHSGVALANQHAGTARALERLHHELPRHEQAVDELGLCLRLGLQRAAVLLAADLSGGRVVPAPDSSAESVLAALLQDARR